MLEYTTRRSMLVVSRDRYILWASSSKAALKTGLFYRTRGQPPIEVPTVSLVGRQEFSERARLGVMQPAGVWLGDDCQEITLRSDKFDQSITLLHFGSAATRLFLAGESNGMQDTFERFQSPPLRRLE